MRVGARLVASRDSFATRLRRRGRPGGAGTRHEEKALPGGPDHGDSVDDRRLAHVCAYLSHAATVVTCSVADLVVVSSAHATKDQSASVAVLTLYVVTSIVAVTGQESILNWESLCNAFNSITS